ncbi:hypothetical protein [Vibrio alginolyticus]|uniref:hypothetical protein n=1 Tax=Vibrio alginolyticus TaxID=663 RepID=UPI001BD29827|nr:hypothetical protein [Vibrio alginolyticus]MBS9926337.1 hypothetical protein [Vibrio alginolyticus]
MIWFIRFALGLPARPEDVVALKQALPELSLPESQVLPRRLFWLLEPTFMSNHELIEALRGWADEIDDSHLSKHRIECNPVNCPMRVGNSIKRNNEEPFVTELLVAAGGPKAKPPKDSFLNLVKQVHPKNDIPSEVIITDPYIYSDVSEDGMEGGYSNLVSYLNALGLRPDDSFTLRMTPSPKRGTITSRKILQRHLKREFKNIKFVDYSPKLKFHDRFYVVRHRSNVIKGVFGPSLNGLSSDAIVLMGDIEGIQPLKKLETWFG